ncbi:AMP-binding protein, partial [Myxococcota bacterium]|nr:AMP-binding protein [Myxococcota bacterium]
MSGSSAVLKASRTLVDLLSRRAESPGRGVAIFSPAGELHEETLSIEALERRSRAIGAALQERRLQGRAVLMLYPSGLDYLAGFFGALFGGVVAVPAYPPEPARLHRTLPRLQAIAKDAGVSAVICTAAVAEAARGFLHLAPELAALEWIATDAVPDEAALSWRAPALSGQSVAYLQYTSGSTASPKGVVIRHDNLLYTLADIDAALRHDSDSVMVTWLPVYHDMGLIYGLLQPIAQGFKGVITPPEAFLQRPLRWLELITRHRGTHNAAPTFAFDLCAQRATPEALATLDLSSWRGAVIAAEPVRPSTMRRFAEAFAAVGFRPETFCPAFGLAEATLKVTIQPVGVAPETLTVDAAALELGTVRQVPADHPDARILSGSGRLHLSTRVLITDPETGLLCPPTRVGEIRVSGPCVASGYWRREAESAATFGDTPPGEPAPWLRTGDLGFLWGDQLYVVGRLKDMIIVRGQNRYPQDIEWTTQDTHRAVRPGCVAAFAVEEGDEERLVILAEVDERRLGQGGEGGAEALASLAAAIRERVTDAHGLAVSGLALLAPQALPKTSSGKVQRHAARAAWRSGQVKALYVWRAAQPSAAPSASQARVDAAALEAWLRARLSPGAPDALDLDAPFTSLGLDSVASVGLSEELARLLGQSLPPSLLWQHPSPRRLLVQLVGRPLPVAAARPAAAAQEPIAVIGLAARLPGADSPEALRALLYEGRDAVGVVPPGRWDGAPGAELAPKAGGFLSQVEGFDARFFGVAPREALAMDPQQRLLLEVSWEALERAGIPANSLAGRSVGVYVGVSASDWETRHLRSGQPARLDPWSATGSALSAAAGRLAYTLDLRGPAMAIDTACSSSLVAIHLACRALRDGDCAMALAGGVNLMLSPELSLCFARMGALSPTGRCRAFDDGADGYVRGEGVGVVVLKPLSAAQRDGDRVLGVLLGSAVNQDGRSHGFTAPNGEAQTAVIRAAMADAGVSPAEVLAVEAHGTGTPLGDPIEIEALAAALGEGRAEPLRVGSVKANIGHLEAAAGVAGLIKALITLGEPTLPPQLHLSAPSHRIPWATLGVEARAEASPWPPGRRVIGVSGFGITGTNAHVILAAAPAAPGDGRAAAPPPYVWPLSAASSDSLRALARRSLDTLHAAAPDATPDLCATAALRRA